MGSDRTLRRVRMLYAALLRLYPRPFRRRFAVGMEQTFHDLCRERRDAGAPLPFFVLALFAETSASIFRERMAMIMPPRKNLLRLATVIACILAVPAVAMQFSDEVDWSLFDFVGAGVLLFGAGFVFEAISRRSADLNYRIATGLACGTGLLLIWLNLAVGLIGSEDNPANVLYVAVLYTGMTGAFVARLRPLGMARALMATAVAQALVPVVALMIFRPLSPGAAGVVGVFMLNTFFVLLFAASALLFRRAGETEPRAA